MYSSLVKDSDVSASTGWREVGNDRQW